MKMRPSPSVGYKFCLQNMANWEVIKGYCLNCVGMRRYLRKIFPANPGNKMPSQSI